MNVNNNQYREECIQEIINETPHDPAHEFESATERHDKIGLQLDQVNQMVVERLIRGESILRKAGQTLSKENPEKFPSSLFVELEKIQPNSIDLTQFDEDDVPSMQLQFDISDEAMSCFYSVSQKLMEQGSYEQAADALFLIVNLNPYEASFLMSLGSAEYYNGDHRAALNAFGLSQVVLPDDPRPLLYAAHCCEALGDKSYAIDLTTQAIDLMKVTPDQEEAITDAEKYLKILKQ